VAGVGWKCDVSCERRERDFEKREGRGEMLIARIKTER
jgi:hypothetical protein